MRLDKYLTTLGIGSRSQAKELIKKEVGIIFSRVLEDAGVFKRNEKGQEGFNKFLNKVI